MQVLIANCYMYNLFIIDKIKNIVHVQMYPIAILIIKSLNIMYMYHVLQVKDCLIPFDDLTCEMVFYWRCLSKYFKSKPEGEGLGFFDRVTPTLSNFCHYFKR